MGGGEVLAALVLLDFDRRRRRSGHGAKSTFQSTDEVPTRLRKGETGTTEKTCACAATGAQACDGRFASTYQLAHCSVQPTSPPVDLPEFPLQRCEPCRTQGNFEVGSVYEGRGRSPSPSSYGLRAASPDRGPPYSARPDKEGAAFASSLRKYPAPPASPDRCPTLHDLQTLIKQAQKKYIAKTAQPTKTSSPSKTMRNTPEKPNPLPEHGNNSSKSLQTYTRGRNSSPKNEGKTAKKGRSGFTSPSPQCSREVRTNDTFDYLGCAAQAPAPARGDRPAASVGQELRRAFGDPRPVTVLPICPKVLSRLEKHRREHHVCDEQRPREDQACSTSHSFPWPPTACGPPEASTSCSIEKLQVCCTCNGPNPCNCKPPICLCRELRLSEDELQERRKLQEIVCAWLDDLPVSAREKPQDKFMRDALIKKLIDTLAAMNEEEFDARGREEIEKCINSMPMWYPQDKQERDKFTKNLVDSLFDKIKGFRKRDRFKDGIANWFDSIEFSEPLNKDEVVDNFSNTLKEIALNRPANDGIYRDKLKIKIFDLLGALPVTATQDREGLVNLKAEQLADELVKLPKSAVKPSAECSKSQEKLENPIAEYARKIADREFGALILKALDEVDGLRELSLEKKETAIKELIPKLPNFLTDDEEYAAEETYDQVHIFVTKLADENGVPLDDEAKVNFIDNLVDNLGESFAHHLEVGESMSQFLTDLPKPPMTAQDGQAGDQQQLEKSYPSNKWLSRKDNLSIHDPMYTEEDQRAGIDSRGQSSSPQGQTEKRRVSGEAFIEDQRTIDGKIGPQRQTDKRRLSGETFLEDDGSLIRHSPDGKRSTSPGTQSDKRRISGQSYIEDDDGSPTQRSPDSKRSPQRQTGKRRVSEQSYLEDEGSPSHRSPGGKRSTSPGTQSDDRRIGGQSYIEDDDGSPTQRSPDGKRSPQRQTGKRRVSEQSYLEDEGSPSRRSTEGKRSLSPGIQSDNRRIGGQSYIEDDDGSPTQCSPDDKRSPQRQSGKRRVSEQSYLEDEESPSRRSPNGKRSLSPSDKRRLSEQSHSDDEGSPTRRSPYSKRSPSSRRQTGKRKSSDQSYVEEDDGSPGGRSSGGKRSPRPQRETDKRRISDRSYVEDYGSPTQRLPDVKRSQRRETDKRRLSDQSYKEDYGSPSRTSRRGSIEESEISLSGYGKTRSDQRQFDDRSIFGKSVTVDQGKRKSQPSEGRSKEVKPYSKDLGYLSDDSMMSDQQRVGARDNLSDSEEVSTFKVKEGTKNRVFASKQGQAREPRKQGAARFDDERSQAYLQRSGGQSIDRTGPGDNSRYLQSDQQNKSDSRRPSLLSDQTKVSQQNDGKFREGHQTRESGSGGGSGASKSSRIQHGEKTVKKMESFLSRFKKRAGLKSDPSIEQYRDEGARRRVNFSSDDDGTPSFKTGPSATSTPRKDMHRTGEDTGEFENKLLTEKKSEQEKLLKQPESDYNKEMFKKIKTGPSAISTPRKAKRRTGVDTDEFGNKLLTEKEREQEKLTKQPESNYNKEMFQKNKTGPSAISTPRKDKRTTGEDTDEFGNKLLTEKEREQEKLVKQPQSDNNKEIFQKNKTGPSAISTPRKDKRRTGEDTDEFGNKLLTEKEREQEKLVKQPESDYNKEMFKKIKIWMNDNDTFESDAEKNNVARDLANDFVDRQKYLQLNPGAKTSLAEELEHMKYQVYKRINKLLDPEQVNDVMSKVPQLMESVKEVPVPQLIKGPLPGTIVVTPQKLEKAIADWIKKTPVFKKQNEKQKIVILNEMVPDLAKDLIFTVQTGMTGADPDEVLIGEIVKKLQNLRSCNARDSLIKGMGKDLLKHLRDLHLISDNLNRSDQVLGSSVMSGFNDVVTKWCHQLPIPSTEQGMKTKQDMANNVMAKIGELNMNPQILNDDILYDDILEDFLDEQLNAVPGIDNKEKLKAELLDEVKKLRQPLQKKMAGQLYNEKLRDTLPKTFPPIDVNNKAEEASFEIMKDNLADAYINLHYVGGDGALREKFKNKINDEIDKFANDYLGRHPNEQICTTQLKKDLYSALKKVDVPGDESMRSEVERVRMKNLVDEWAKELPMKSQTPQEQLHTNKVLKAMTQRLLDLERDQVQSNPSDNYDDKLKKEIEKYVKKLPVKDNASVSEQNRRLIKKIKDTEHSRTFTEGSRRSVDFDGLSFISAEDREHMQRIRDRSGRSASMSGICQHCRSVIMQAPSSCVPPCKDAAVSPPRIDRCSQTDMTVKLNQNAQCQCSSVQIPPPAPTPCSNRPTPLPVHACLSGARSHVSIAIPCNTPRNRVSTGSQVNITPYIVIDEYHWDAPTDQIIQLPSHPCISSQSIPRSEPRGIITPEPCYSPPSRAKVTKLGSFNSDEYNRGLSTPPRRRNVVRDISDCQRPTPIREPCQNPPRKVWSRPHIYRDTAPPCVSNEPVKCACKGQTPKCRGRRPMSYHTCNIHKDPVRACHRCCGAKCPHPTQFFFK